MLVKDWMSTKVITVDMNDSVRDAIDVLKTHGISMLPVMHEGRLVGIVSELDLKSFASPPASAAGTYKVRSDVSKLRVQDVMTQAPVTVPLDFTVEETADVLMTHRISGVPVADRDKQIVGVITQTDISRVMVSVTGLWRGGIVFGFLLEDRAGSIKELTDTMRSYGGRLASILTSYERVPRGYRKVHIRVRRIDRSELPKLKEELQQKATMIYMVDQRENIREIFEVSR